MITLTLEDRWDFNRRTYTFTGDAIDVRTEVAHTKKEIIPIDDFLNIRQRKYFTDREGDGDLEKWRVFLTNLSKEVNPDKLSPESWLHTAFWNCFNPEKFNSFMVEIPYFKVYFSKAGVAWYGLRYDGTYNPSDWQTLACFWLNGPITKIADFETRKSIREKIISALEFKDGFDEQDGFPLMDYTKIKNYKIEFLASEWEGEFVQLNKETIEVGGWDRMMGGSHDWTYEYFRTCHKEINPRIPDKKLTRILLDIEAAIVS